MTTSKRSIHISAHVSVRAALMSPPHNSNVGLPQPAGRRTLVHTSTARHVRETTVYGRYVHHGRGSASQRGRSVAAKSMLSSSVRAFRGRGASSSGARGDRLSARCSSRAATGQAAASETGVCVCVCVVLSRRVLTPHGPWRGPHGCTKSAVVLRAATRRGSRGGWGVWGVRDSDTAAARADQPMV